MEHEAVLDLTPRAAPAAAPSGAVAQAMAIAAAFAGDPAMQWSAVDDKCDCVYQRVGWWSNPYLGETLEVRLCCAWAYLFEQFPAMAEFQRVTSTWTDPNTGEESSTPRPWDSDEGDMPRAIWYRQLARLEGKPLAQVRAERDGQQPPRAVSR